MTTKHKKRSERSRHLSVERFPEADRVAVRSFVLWSRENLRRDPTESEVRRFLASRSS